MRSSRARDRGDHVLCKLTRSHDNTQMNSFLCVTCFSASAEECPAELGEEAKRNEEKEAQTK